jgi:uncharacterized membrane protein (DUF106 family)
MDKEDDEEESSTLRLSPEEVHPEGPTSYSQERSCIFFSLFDYRRYQQILRSKMIAKIYWYYICNNRKSKVIRQGSIVW